jgi:hypothetical protein
LARERVIGPFFFEEDIITSNYFLDLLENYALLQPNSNNYLIIHLNGVTVRFAHIARDWT